MKQTELEIKTTAGGLYLVTSQVVSKMRSEWGRLPSAGLLNLFIAHTSASLVIQENASLSAQSDLESFLNRLVPPNQDWHQHTDEGPDDTTSHLKAAITQTFLNIPIVGGQLGLGTWQGIYIWEHRDAPHVRRLILSLME